MSGENLPSTSSFLRGSAAHNQVRYYCTWKAMVIKTRNVLFKKRVQHLQNNSGLLKDFGVMVGWENQGGIKDYPCTKVIPELTQSRPCLTFPTDTT